MYRKLKNIIVLCICISTVSLLGKGFLFNESTCFAEDINFEVTVDRTKVSLGTGIQLNLNFYGTQNISAPQLPDIEGFDSRYLGPSSRISIVNGQVSSSITHIYTLIPLKAGQFNIPSFTVEYNGQEYASQPIPVEVVQGSVSAPQGLQQESIPQESSQDLEDRVFIVMEPGKKRAYVNEIIPLKIKLYINRLAVRDIQYPEFEHVGFSADKFAEPRQYQAALGGIAYDVIEFATNLFGTYAGELQLGPATLQCNLILKKQSRSGPRSIFDDDFFGSGIFGDFFGSYERYPLNLSSPNIPIEILPLPEEGKPVDFSGALGNYNFDLQVNPKEVKVGDPITLKMTISGDGNLKTVNIPELRLGDNFKAYDPEVKQDQRSKTFEQVIIPKSEDVKEVPQVSFSFFNTINGQYSMITKGPIPIKVTPLAKGEELKMFTAPGEKAEAMSKKETLGRDIIYIKDSIGELRQKGSYLCKNKPFLWLQIFPLLAVMGVSIFQKRKERLLSDVRYARRIRAPRKAKKNLNMAKDLLALGDQIKFFDAAFKTLQEYLGDKLHLASMSITANVVDEELKPRNIGDALLEKIKTCFSYCDTARYAPASVAREQMQETFNLLEEIIDGLERIKL